MTNLEECLRGCTLVQLKELRDLTGGWCKGGYSLYRAIGNYYKTAEVQNTAIIEASCGQKVTVELNNIDKSQPISKVTIRGVEYTPK